MSLLRKLQLFDTRTPADLDAELRSFDDFGSRTVVEELNGIPHYLNEFWTARQRQAHRIHEISYRACFKPQLPAFFIERLTEVGDIVYDPFMGRGTTPIEAALRNRVPFGNDVNPLSRSLVEPRINAPTFTEIVQRLSEVPWSSFNRFEREDLLTFYHCNTLAQIEGLRDWLLTRERDGSLDQVDKWIRMVAINRLTGHSSGFFSVYTLPPNQAVSVESQRKINEKRGQVPEERSVPRIILKKTKNLLSQCAPRAENVRFSTGPAESSEWISDASVSLTVTSPPFLDIVNYENDNWLRCWFMDVNPRNVSISTHRSVESWQRFISATLTELCRLTREGGHVAFEVGEVRRGTVLLEQSVIAAASGTSLTPVGVIINQQEFTKTSNCWGVGNNSLGTNSNRIVLFRKTA